MRVELRQINKRFGSVHANQDVSLTVEAGMIHGLLGENGAGKSTLVKILSGFQRADSGTILLNGDPVQFRSPQGAIQAGIGMLHQDPLDFPNLSVLDNFLSGGWMSPHQARERLQTLATELHFRLDPQERVRHLSVGERQQLEIVRLLHLGVQTLVLDEPTTGISAAQKEALFAAMQLLATQGKSIIFVSHKLADVQQLCQQVTVMRQGMVAGSRSLPCAETELVHLMFGKPLSVPTKPVTCQPQSLLRLHDIQVHTHRLHIHIPALTVHRGEILGLAGLEGNGQDLLLRCCAGLLPPEHGQVILDDLDLSQQPYSAFRRAGIGYLPADRLREGLVPGLTIQEHTQLRYPSPGLMINPSTSLERTQTLIQHFSIRGQALSRVEQLSGGNQQRTQLALLPDDLHLILLEHPTRGLDMESADWIWQQLTARCQQGAAILFMSADVDELCTYSDRILVFSGGRVSEPIPTSDLPLEKLGSLMGGSF
ncbi:MAG: ATP-binding cassette domain-containing protein [Synechococcales cyanobacterium]